MRFVALVSVVTMACGGGSSMHRGDSASTIEHVHVRTVESDLIVHYRTPTAVRDCKAQATEMPKVWDLVLKNRLTGSSAQKVILFPENPSGESVSTAFVKSADGRWVSTAFCGSIIIQPR